jgi:hypothetical protein
MFACPLRSALRNGRCVAVSLWEMQVEQIGNAAEDVAAVEPSR